jgi:hypothetical protein
MDPDGATELSFTSEEGEPYPVLILRSLRDTTQNKIGPMGNWKVSVT